MNYTLGQAAKATGKSKPTIQRAIKNGRISASREHDGSYVIEPSELHRVFEPVMGGSNEEQGLKQSVPITSDSDVERLKGVLEGLEKAYRQIEGERDNLREQLAESNEERRTTLRQLTALLTDQRAKEETKSRSWWNFGRW
jgi:hypothetical protein